MSELKLNQNERKLYTSPSFGAPADEGDGNDLVPHASDEEEDKQLDNDLNDAMLQANNSTSEGEKEGEEVPEGGEGEAEREPDLDAGQPVELPTDSMAKIVISRLM